MSATGKWPPSSWPTTIEEPEDAEDYFYALADALLNKLMNDRRLSDSDSRLWLAEQLGILGDRRWLGEVDLPLSGNTPRHRVIARFAVENRIRAIVNLNWDTLLEAALDSVGLTENPDSPRPWENTAYARVIHDAQIPRLARPGVTAVLKPHGCVRDIAEARRARRSTGPRSVVTLKLTKSELQELPNGQTEVDKRVNSDMASYPVIALGWKASEGYLRKTIVAAAKSVKATWPDRFTLVNRTWYANHDEIALAYGISKLEAFVEVGKDNQPRFDCLFLWLQARYALTRLIQVASTPQKAKLQELMRQIDRPACGPPYHPVLCWADRWLPSWVRLCWRAGVVQGCNPHTNRKIEAWQIPITPRDVHVPLLGAMTNDRRELVAASKLLTTIGENLIRFNFDTFSGGLWDEEKARLYIPLPTWGNPSQRYDLTSLKPQVEDMHKWGFVKEIQLISLDTGDGPAGQEVCRQLEAQVRSLMPVACFADVNALTWASLESLKGAPNAPVA